MPTIDLDVTSLRDFNQMLHDLGEGANDTDFHVVNPRGKHAIGAGGRCAGDASRLTAMSAITAGA